MAKLSWVRITRRFSGIIRQKELTHLEKLIDLEADRQPARNLFVLSCAIPACIAAFGGLSVFAAWLAGNTGLPLILGTALTVGLGVGSWFIFYRLYKSISPSDRDLRELVHKFSIRYNSVGNMILGESILSDKLEPILDEATRIFLKHEAVQNVKSSESVKKAQLAIKNSLIKLLEVANLEDHNKQENALDWAVPMLEEMKLLDQTLSSKNSLDEVAEMNDPLAGLREARSELETRKIALEELEQFHEN